ncbi:PQQ-binding-like beta-propeller repeat protein [Candidatus Poribacteria bacterium]|nr:PQQ-binding-like beta-propeller repeat protein [Candidatus Poribacteria bacterium]
MYTLSDDGAAWQPGMRMMSGGLAVSGGRIFVATAAGVQASDGVGMLWRVMSAGLDSQRVTCIAAVGPSLWAGTAQTSGGAVAGIYRWDDLYRSWTLTTDDVWGYGPHPGKIAALQGCGGYVFASALGTVWRHGGVQPRWRKTGGGLRGQRGGALAAHDGRLYTTAGGSLYRLNAATWTWEPTSAEPEGPLGGVGQALWASAEGVYVGTDMDGVYRSTDGGASWVNIGLSDVRVWALRAYRGAIYAGGRYGGGVHRWRDDDNGWQPVNQGLQSPPHPMRAITAMGDRLYAVVDDRLHVSCDDGTTWAPVDAPSNDIVALTAANGVLYAGTRGDGLYVMDAATGSWRQSTPAEMDLDAAWIAVVGDTIYAGTADGGMYASAEQLSRHARETMRVRVDDARVLLHDDARVYVVNGQGLLLSSHGGRGGGRSPDVSHAITAAAVLDGAAYVATADRGVLRSFGSKWRPENDGLPTSDVRGMARLGETLYAGVYGAGVFRGANPAPDKEEAGLRPAERAKRAARRGRAPLSWTPVGEEAPMSQALALAASETTLYVAATGGDIYASADAAASWRLATTTPDAMEARGLAVLEGALYVATDRGVFRAQVDGDWQAVPLTPPVIRSVAARDGAAFVLTNGGVYRAASPDGPWARISRHAEPLTHIELHGGALYGAQDYGVVLRADLDD